MNEGLAYGDDCTVRDLYQNILREVPAEVTDMATVQVFIKDYQGSLHSVTSVSYDGDIILAIGK